MRLPGKKSLVKSGRWLRSRVTSGSLILGYHRVSENENDIYSTCVRPDNFAEQMAVLRQQANPISLDKLIEDLKRGTLPQKAVVVTFDDGYADNLYQAKPILEKFEIPVTLFVASEYIGRHFWWDEAACLLQDADILPPELSLQVNGESITWQVSENPDRSFLVEKVYRYLLGLTPKQRRQALDQLILQIDPTYDQYNCGVRALTPQELVDFASDDLVTIGAHSVTHPFLASLSREAQRQEIEQSKQDLEGLLGQPVNSFSYPNGSSNEITRALIREAGYTSACTSDNDVANLGSDLFNLPRFWVPDQTGSKFSSWLNWWLAN